MKCSRCPNEAGKKVRCSVCEIKHKQCRKALEKRRADAGLCRTCGEKSTASTCEKCKKRLKENVEKRRTAGLCINCGASRPSTEGYIPQQCLRCFVKNTWRQATGKNRGSEFLLELMKSQNNICPYTGEFIQIGVNASIDHILSKARFPESASNNNNFQWTHRRVNLMKGDLTNDEFFSLMKRILDYAKPVNG